MTAWQVTPDGILLAVRVTPRAARSVFAGATPEQFAVRLAAPPVDGAANAALVELVAKSFGVSRRAVALVSGDTSRHKRLSVRGDPAALADRAASLYAGAHDG